MLLLDISRLIWRARRRGPTGIDRVELAYAQHFIASRGNREAYGVLHLFGLLFAVSPAGGRRFIEELSARWEGSASAQRQPGLFDTVKMYVHLFTSAWFLGPWLRRKLSAHPGSPIFLVVSHHHVARDYTIARIRRSYGAKTACLLHDLIPVEYPEYFLPGWEERYRRLTGNIGRFFDAVIANSESTARSLRTCLENEPDAPLGRVDIRTAALGVRAFARPPVGSAAAPDRLRARPYFVVVGTIEPRKNHLLLLNLWTRLACSMPAPPRLLLIGSRGWENEQVVDMLERSRRLRGLVEEHNELSDAQVGALVHQARALLLPSFAEGFGLPLAEALASGVPAICSDIPVFREVGRDAPEYLDPLNLQAWSEAVLEYCHPDSARRTSQLQRLARWQTPRWVDHFKTVEQMLDGLGGCSPSVLSVSSQQTL